MKKLLTLATLLLGSTAINPAHALFGDPPTKLFSEEQTWRVGWDQSIGEDGLGICYTYQTFSNRKIHIWISSKVGTEPMSDSWLLAIYIPDLKLKVGDKHKFSFEMENVPAKAGYKGYDLEMGVTEHADHKKFFFAFINKEFANYLATDRKVQWMQIDLMGAKFARLDMAESARGIRGVVGCRKEILAAVAANAREDNPENRAENKPKEERASYGTGFFVASGYVLTNYHVVNECTQAYVKYPGFKKAEAYLKGSDAANDLAVIVGKNA